jgi:hypothetical protein
MIIFRGLKFEHNADIGQKSHFWSDTTYMTTNTSTKLTTMA